MHLISVVLASPTVLKTDIDLNAGFRPSANNFQFTVLSQKGFLLQQLPLKGLVGQYILYPPYPDDPNDKYYLIQYHIEVSLITPPTANIRFETILATGVSGNFPLTPILGSQSTQTFLANTSGQVLSLGNQVIIKLSPGNTIGLLVNFTDATGSNSKIPSDDLTANTFTFNVSEICSCH